MPRASFLKSRRIPSQAVAGGTRRMGALGCVLGAQSSAESSRNPRPSFDGPGVILSPSSPQEPGMQPAPSQSQLPRCLASNSSSAINPPVNVAASSTEKSRTDLRRQRVPDTGRTDRLSVTVPRMTVGSWSNKDAHGNTRIDRLTSPQLTRANAQPRVFVLLLSSLFHQHRNSSFCSRLSQLI